MVININPNRINVGGGVAGKASDRKRSQADSGNSYTVPKRADVNYIPAPESLFTLISSAVEALRNGVTWDRGTIINILA
jgi:hypothetical protein